MTKTDIDLRRAGLPEGPERTGLQRPMTEAINKIEKHLNQQAHHRKVGFYDE